jgi:hypothetical protein
MRLATTEEVEMHRPPTTDRDWLAITAISFLVANLLHGADHIRQHFAGVDTEVLVGGGMLTAAAVAVAIITSRQDRRAPLLATFVGFIAAALVAASHLAPHWGALSDSYINDIHPDALSWVVMVLEVVAGLLLGVVGAHRLRAPTQRADNHGTLRMLPS